MHCMYTGTLLYPGQQMKLNYENTANSAVMTTGFLKLHLQDYDEYFIHIIWYSIESSLSTD